MNSSIRTETLSIENVQVITEMCLEFWSDCTFEEEFENFVRILNTESETCFLLKNSNDYIGYIYLALRSDYVEGAESNKVTFIEGIYIRAQYRRKGLGSYLVDLGRQWGKTMGSREYASNTEIENSTSQIFHEKLGFQEVNRTVNFLKTID